MEDQYQEDQYYVFALFFLLLFLLKLVCKTGKRKTLRPESLFDTYPFAYRSLAAASSGPFSSVGSASYRSPPAPVEKPWRRKPSIKNGGGPLLLILLLIGPFDP